MPKLALNVGSGQRRFTSTPEVTWVNIDSQFKPGHEPDIQCDGAHLTMYQDGEVDYFVLHHVLEHFGCGESAGLIKEAYRVLKPGGSLIVCVPDLRALAVGWLQGRISTQIYVTNLYGAYMGNDDDRHKWGFDNEELLTFLVSTVRTSFYSGGTWAWARAFNFRKIPGADIAADWWILGMEAVK